MPLPARAGVSLIWPVTTSRWFCATDQFCDAPSTMPAPMLAEALAVIPTGYGELEFIHVPLSVRTLEHVRVSVYPEVLKVNPPAVLGVVSVTVPAVPWKTATSVLPLAQVE